MAETLPDVSSDGYNYSGDYVEYNEVITNHHFIYPYKTADKVTRTETVSGTDTAVDHYGYSSDVTLLTSGSPADKSVTFTNALNTRDITAVKEWNDSDFDTSLHYALRFNLSNDDISLDRNMYLAVSDTNNAVVFTSLPKYNAKGEEIVYKLTEDKASGTFTDSGTAGTFSSSGTDADEDLFELGSAKYGYSAECKIDRDSEENLVSQYNVTNTLPVINLQATVQWIDDNNRDGVRPDSVNVYLSKNNRTATAKHVVLDVDSKNDAKTLWTTSKNETYSIGVMPVYDENNEPIVYGISEQAPESPDPELTSEESGNEIFTKGEYNDKLYITHHDNKFPPVQMFDKNSDGIWEGTVIIDEVTADMLISGNKIPINIKCGDAIIGSDSEFEAEVGKPLAITIVFDPRNGDTPGSNWTVTASGASSTQLLSSLGYEYRYDKAIKVENGTIVKVGGGAFEYEDPTTASGEGTGTELSYVFEIVNEREVDKGSIQINKEWLNDEDNKWHTRPASLSVNLSWTDRGSKTGSTVLDPDEWTNTVGDLYVNTNPTGNAVEPGSSYAIVYNVSEVVPSQYTGTVSGGTATLESDGDIQTVDLQNTLQKVTKTITKQWVDNNGVGAGDLHFEVTATITETHTNVTESITIPVSETSATIELPAKVYSEGSLVTAEYTVTEDSSCIKNGYVDTYTNGTFTTSTSTIKITNTLPVTQFVIDRTWNDDGNRDGLRPSAVSYTLKRKVGDTVDSDFSVSASVSDNGTSSGWNTNLSSGAHYPTYSEDNTAYTYYLEETAYTNVEKYGSSASGTPDGQASGLDSAVQGTPDTAHRQTDTFYVTSYYIPEQKKITVTKTWSGESGFTSWTRPDTYTLPLSSNYNNGTITSETPVSLDSVSELSHDFSDLYVKTNPTGTTKINGTSYFVTYHVTETAINGYTTAYDKDSVIFELGGADDSVAVTNTLILKPLKVKKVWNYSDTPDTITHLAVTANITMNGFDDLGLIGSATTTASQDSENLSDAVSLPLYNKNGQTAQYTVTETTSAQYNYTMGASTTVTALSAGDEITIATLTNILPVKFYFAKKNWDDDNNRDGLRPASVTFALQRKIASDSGFTTVAALSAASDSGWLVSFGAYPTHDSSNNEYTYQITETVPTNYTLADTDTTSEAVDGVAGKKVTYIFKNKYTPDTGSLTLNKQWDGDTVDNFYQWTRPDSLEFELWCKYKEKESDTLYKTAKVSSVDRLKGYLDADHRSDSTYTLTSSNASAGDSALWTVTISGLPLRINETGSDMYTPNSEAQLHGSSTEVTYFFVEKPVTVSGNNTLNGYRNIGYTSTDTLSDIGEVNSAAGSLRAYYPANEAYPAIKGLSLSKTVSRSITVTNELVKRNITLTKAWNDKGSDNIESLENTDHDAARVKVTMSVPGVNTDYENTVTNVTAAAKNVPNISPSADVGEFPLYTKDGELAKYKVEELTEGASGDSYINYRYIPTYKKGSTAIDQSPLAVNSDDFTLDTAEDAVTAITVTNNLPLTTITATKNWYDLSNRHLLRPSSITDYLNLERSVDGTNWNRVEVKTSSSDSTMTEVTPSVTSEQSSSDTWTYTYKNLRQYDKNGALYTYRIVEDIDDIKGYELNASTDHS